MVEDEILLWKLSAFTTRSPETEEEEERKKEGRKGERRRKGQKEKKRKKKKKKKGGGEKKRRRREGGRRGRRQLVINWILTSFQTHRVTSCFGPHVRNSLPQDLRHC